MKQAYMNARKDFKFACMGWVDTPTVIFQKNFHAGLILDFLKFFSQKKSFSLNCSVFYFIFSKN